MSILSMQLLAPISSDSPMLTSVVVHTGRIAPPVYLGGFSISLIMRTNLDRSSPTVKKEREKREIFLIFKLKHFRIK